MKIKIYSRKSVEQLLQNGFPANTAVISFYNSPDGLNATQPVDYAGAAERVFQIPLDDFQTDMPEAAGLAKFIDEAMSDGLNMICQCESGQNRSAGCAAAILEHYSHAGLTVFDNIKYHPDTMVYYAVLDALEAIS